MKFTNAARLILLPCIMAAAVVLLLPKTVDLIWGGRTFDPNAQCKLEMKNLRAALVAFRDRYGSYPKELGLDELLHQPAWISDASWQGPMVVGPTDPWNRLYEFRYDSAGTAHIISKGQNADRPEDDLDVALP